MFLPIYFMLFAVAATLPATGKDQELVAPLTAEDLKDIDKIIVNITVVAKENSKGTRQEDIDEDAITDIAGDSGGLKLATHIVNLLLGGLGGIGMTLGGGGGGAGGAGTAGTAAGSRPKSL